jgi:hypothetical protein
MIEHVVSEQLSTVQIGRFFFLLLLRLAKHFQGVCGYDLCLFCHDMFSCLLLHFTYLWFE